MYVLSFHCRDGASSFTLVRQISIGSRKGGARGAGALQFLLSLHRNAIFLHTNVLW